jgi:hypothetical protein
MLSKFRLPILCLLLIMALAVVAAVFVPWKSAMEGQLKAMLEAQGFRNVQLTVSGLGFKSVTLKDISIGEPRPLILKNLTLNYSFAELWSGRLGEMVLSGLDIEGHLEGSQWKVKGLEGLLPDTKPAAGFSVPMEVDRLIPFEQGKLEASQLRLSGPWELSVPLNISWQKKPQPEFTYQGTGLSFKASPLEITTGEASARLALKAESKQWQGPWQLKNVAVKGAATPLPALEGAGDMVVQADATMIKGRFKSADNSYATEFRLDYAPNAPKKSRFTLIEAILPWNEGRLSVQNVLVPLEGKRDLSFPIKVEHVSVDALMQTLTGKQASGTGTVSGALPVTIKADGTILVHEGNLKAEAPGKITLSPEAIPGDNEQVALVREILKDLHYTLLSITMENGPDQKSSVLMTLEGRNPAVYDGRPVKLNVRLTGDVLNLVQQSIMPLLDPRLLLRQDKNEKK